MGGGGRAEEGRTWLSGFPRVGGWREPGAVSGSSALGPQLARGPPAGATAPGLPAEAIASPCHLPKAVARPQSAGLAQTAWCPAQPQTRQCSSRPVEEGRDPGACPGSPGGLQPPLSRCSGSSPLEPLRFHHPQPEDKAGGRGRRVGTQGSQEPTGHCVMQQPGPPLEPRHATALPGGQGVLPWAWAQRPALLRRPPCHLGSPGPPFLHM